MIPKPVEDVKGGEVFFAIHPEETEVRAWTRIWAEVKGTRNPAIPCGQSFFCYAGKKKYITLSPNAFVLV